MPRKSTGKASPAIKKKVVKTQIRKATAAPSLVARPQRSGRGQVKTNILAALATGPKTSAQLLKSGGFSVASLYLNLKQLKAEHRVIGGGRGGAIRLAEAVASAAPAATARPALPVLKPAPTGPVVMLSDYVSGPLHDALESVSARFAAPDRIGEKLHTLEQLARSLPAPVAEVLLSIREDLLRLSPARKD